MYSLPRAETVNRFEDVVSRLRSDSLRAANLACMLGYEGAASELTDIHALASEILRRSLQGGAKNMLGLKRGSTWSPSEQGRGTALD